MRGKRLMIRSMGFEPEGLETRTKRRTIRNPRVENRITIPPLVEVNIQINRLRRDIKLDVRDKKASFLIGWYSGIPSPEIITSTNEIEKFVMTRIERLRSRLGDNGHSRAGRSSVNKDEYAAKIEIMKNSLGLMRSNGSWQKNPAEITHALKIPSKFGVTTDHAILTVGVDGLTVTPLTEQEGWVKMITPKSYNFTFDIKPGESAMVKFGFKW